MNKHWLRSFLTVLLVLVSSFVCSQTKEVTFRQLDTGTVSLSGEWLFFWDQLLTPEQFLSSKDSALVQELPLSWHHFLPSIEQNPYWHGTATIAIEINLDQVPRQRIGLLIERISEAYQLWYIPTDQPDEAELIFFSGVLGGSKQSQRFSSSRQIVALPADAQRFWLMFQVSKQELLLGGITAPIELDYLSELQRKVSYVFISKGFVIGGMIFLALHYMVLLFYQRLDRVAFFLSLASLIIALRAFLVSGFFEYFFPDTNSTVMVWRHRVEFMTFIVGSSAFVSMFSGLFTGILKPRWLQISWIGTGLCSLYIALIDGGELYLRLPMLQLWLLFNCVLIVSLMVTAVKRRYPLSIKILLSALLILLGVFHDIYSSLSEAYSLYIVEYMLLLFLFFQSQVIASRYKMALVASRELAKQNTELTKETAKAKLRESLDHLTGMYNRFGLESKLAVSWQLCYQHNQPLSLIMLDVDHFKKVNDKFGHMVGDEALVFLSSAIRGHNFRQQDYFGRWGGEEFLIVLPDTPLIGAVQVAENLKISLNQSVFIADGQRIPLRCSYGVSSFIPSGNLSISDLIENADHALYEAKKGGRNRVRTYPLMPAK